MLRRILQYRRDKNSLREDLASMSDMADFDRIKDLHFKELKYQLWLDILPPVICHRYFIKERLVATYLGIQEVFRASCKLKMKELFGEHEEELNNPNNPHALPFGFSIDRFGRLYNPSVKFRRMLLKNK